MKRLFILLVVCVCNIVVYAADKNKYDGLISQCLSWSDKRILQAADRVLTKGDKERALVLYMVVCFRDLKSKVDEAIKLFSNLCYLFLLF